MQLLQTPFLTQISHTRNPQVLGVERDYDGAGVLRGVRQLTGVKGGWSGGKM